MPTMLAGSRSGHLTPKHVPAEEHETWRRLLRLRTTYRAYVDYTITKAGNIDDPPPILFWKSYASSYENLTLRRLYLIRIILRLLIKSSVCKRYRYIPEAVCLPVLSSPSHTIS